MPRRTPNCDCVVAAAPHTQRSTSTVIISFYGTAPAPQCVREVAGSAGYQFVCTLTDDAATHELRRVSIADGAEEALVKGTRGITEIAHDELFIYWLELSGNSARDSAGCEKTRMSRERCSTRSPSARRIGVRSL